MIFLQVGTSYVNVEAIDAVAQHVDFDSGVEMPGSNVMMRNGKMVYDSREPATIMRDLQAIVRKSEDLG